MQVTQTDKQTSRQFIIAMDIDIDLCEDFAGETCVYEMT